jgi:hypothetical protein
MALVAHVAFPSSSADVAPLLEPGARADKEIIAPFNFVVNKSEDELQRESEELAASAKPIYEFRQRVYDSSATTMAAFFSAVDAVADQSTQAIIHAAADFGVALTPQEASYLAKGGKRRAVQQALVKLFDRTLAQGVTGPGVLQVAIARADRAPRPDRVLGAAGSGAHVGSVPQSREAVEPGTQLERRRRTVSQARPPVLSAHADPQPGRDRAPPERAAR